MKETVVAGPSYSCGSPSAPLWSNYIIVCAFHATKADVAGPAVDHLRMPRRRAVAPAVVRRAEMGAALDYLARDPDLGLRRVVTQGPARRLDYGGSAGAMLNYLRRLLGRTPRACANCSTLAVGPVSRSQLTDTIDGELA